VGPAPVIKVISCTENSRNPFNVVLNCTVSESTPIADSVVHAARIVIKHGSKVIASGNGRLKGQRITATLRTHGKLAKGWITVTITVPGLLPKTFVHAKAGYSV
jgi:hypothetical protein